jgi:cell division septation protein DedD
MAPGTFNEPKRVKTQTIRPDAINDAIATAQPPAGSARGAPMAIAPQSDPAPRTKMAARTPAPAAAGAYLVQVSAQKSEAEAQSSYRILQQKYPSVLGGREPTIRRAELGQNSVWYRVHVGSFTTAEQATAFCNNLKEAGGQCIVQRN